MEVAQVCSKSSRRRPPPSVPSAVRPARRTTAPSAGDTGCY
jgi:hypothetical protein